jgi:hypothetical protein
LLAGIEDRYDAGGFWVYAGEVGSLLSVACRAAEREIFRLVFSAVLLGDDVIDMEACDVAGLDNSAVFAPISSAIHNEFARRGFDHASGRRGVLFQGQARFGLEEREEIGGLDVAVVFLALLRGEGAGGAFLGEFLQTLLIGFRESEIKDFVRRLGR